MKLKIQKPLSPAVIADLKKATNGTPAEGEIAVGNTYINYDGGDSTYFYRIEKITEGKDRDGNKHAVIHYTENHYWDGTGEWEGGGQKEASDFFSEGTYLITGSIKDWMDKAVDIIATQNFDAIRDNSPEIKENALVSPDSKAALMLMEADMKQKRNHVGLMKAFVSREMARRMQDMREVKNQLNEILEVFRDKVEKISKVISRIELYLGVHEQIVQIAEGAKASATSPICFRQQILFMDEEVGDPENGGWDFNNIHGFDTWLVEKERFKKICPEEKCIVVFKPRRESKFYHENAFLQAFIDANNSTTYFLIRNGNCLYRIWANIEIGERLFPRRTEFEEILATIQDYRDKGHDWNKSEIKNLENEIHEYQKRAAMLQGLIDRTEVFLPLAKPVSIMRMEEAGGLIQFIYDDELALPTGRKLFWDWWRDINSKIVRGSRVIHTGVYKSDGRWANPKDYEDYWFRYYGDWNRPPLPGEGLYEVDLVLKKESHMLPYYYVEELERKGLLISKEKSKTKSCYHEGYPQHPTNKYLPEDTGMKIKTLPRKGFGSKELEFYIESYDCAFWEEIFFIRYNPKDTISSWTSLESHQRKNRIRFMVDPRHDKYIFNYDQISMEDIDFYLESRVDRASYSTMMPILRIWKKHRMEELKWEKDFVEFIKRRAQQRKLRAKVDLDKLIWGAIDWWKHKVIWKRPITKNDTLALRMIERRIFSQESIKKNFVQ